MKAMTVDGARMKKIKELSPVSLISALCVCRDRLHFGKDKLRKFTIEFQSQLDCINGDYITFQDLKECLGEDDGVVLPYDYESMINVQSTKETRQAVEYISVANSTALMCTVLCDKFGFGKVKVTQAVKQYKDIFNQLKDDRFMVNRIKDEFLRDYDILIY